MLYLDKKEVEHFLYPEMNKMNEIFLRFFEKHIV